MWQNLLREHNCPTVKIQGTLTGYQWYPAQALVPGSSQLQKHAVHNKGHAYRKHGKNPIASLSSLAHASTLIPLSTYDYAYDY